MRGMPMDDVDAEFDSRHVQTAGISVAARVADWDPNAGLE
jgi:hypothetical protein